MHTPSVWHLASHGSKSSTTHPYMPEGVVAAKTTRVSQDACHPVPTCQARFCLPKGHLIYESPPQPAVDTQQFRVRIAHEIAPEFRFTSASIYCGRRWSEGRDTGSAKTDRRLSWATRVWNEPCVKIHFGPHSLGGRRFAAWVRYGDRGHSAASPRDFAVMSIRAVLWGHFASAA